MQSRKKRHYEIFEMSNMSRLKQSLIKYNNLDDFLAGKGEAIADITKSMQLLKKMKNQIEMKNVAMMSQTEEDEVLAEIQAIDHEFVPPVISKSQIRIISQPLRAYKKNLHFS